MFLWHMHKLHTPIAGNSYFYYIPYGYPKHSISYFRTHLEFELKCWRKSVLFPIFWIFGPGEIGFIRKHAGMLRGSLIWSNCNRVCLSVCQSNRYRRNGLYSQIYFNNNPIYSMISNVLLSVRFHFLAMLDESNCSAQEGNIIQAISNDDYFSFSCSWKKQTNIVSS